MTDVDVPAVDKASAHGPDVIKPASKDSAPAEQPFLAVCPPAPAHMIEGDDARRADKLLDEPTDEMVPSAEENKLNGRVGHSLVPPKPVQVMSVPETPVNGSTPAGGTPRPELTIPEDPSPSAAKPPGEPDIEPVVLTGAEEPKATPATSVPDEKESKPSPDGGMMEIDKPEEKQLPPVTHTGPESESVPAPAPAPVAAPVAAPLPEMPDAPAITTGEPPASTPAAQVNENVVGGKRKLDEEDVVPPVDGATRTDSHSADNQAASTTLPLDKKPKLGEHAANSSGDASKAAAPVPVSSSAPTLNADPVPDPPAASPALTDTLNSKNGNKPKKDKKLPAVGRAARKTRSQGPADV
ncbi:hypothetical protein NOR_08049 [Metarhizium rileyi]|uniref:Uncharacterized protein n=1 Tax=Metarhizium rileyi (strain RCEF 4871) TaxID=1649241 RepID=A0A166X0J0_METRR|nr:hypothetical protein NOR_08049 [Metarhizium rileyi RCEF 4871]